MLVDAAADDDGCGDFEVAKLKLQIKTKIANEKMRFMMDSASFR